MSPSTIMALHHHYLLSKENDKPFNITQIKSGGIINSRVNQSLGKGGYGEVHATKGPFTGSPWAVKFAPHQSDAPTKHSLALIQESQVLLGPLRNAPHTIQLKGIYRSSQKVEIVMRRLQGPDLDHHIHQTPNFFTYKIWQSIARQAMEALQYYREKKIVHADIKAANCFYNSETNELTIIDFGNAFSPDIASGPNAFTLSSIAPERLMKSRSSYGIDMWALGVMLFKIYTGYGLFLEGSVDQDEQSITKVDILALMGEQFPDSCPTYIRTLKLEKRHQCTRAEIQEQFSAADLKQAGMKYIPPFKKKIDPWYRESWKTRIRQAAHWKNESKDSKDIIGLLEKMFVFDDSKRLTPEDGLRILSSLTKDPMVPETAFRSNRPILESMQELNLEDASAKFLDLEISSQAADQERLIFSSLIKDPTTLEIAFRSNSPILELMQELNLEDASAKFLDLEISRAKV